MEIRDIRMRERSSSKHTFGNAYVNEKEDKISRLFKGFFTQIIYANILEFFRGDRRNPQKTSIRMACLWVDNISRNCENTKKYYKLNHNFGRLKH
jgi:hypothetical protein